MAEPAVPPRREATAPRPERQGSAGWVRALPNLLTGFRVLAIPVIIWLLLWDGQASNQAAVCLYIVAGISDVLDGYFARRFGSGTQLGVFFDLVGDKLLVAALLITMVELGLDSRVDSLRIRGTRTLRHGDAGLRRGPGRYGQRGATGQNEDDVAVHRAGLADLGPGAADLGAGAVRAGPDDKFRAALFFSASHASCADGPRRTFRTRYEVTPT